MSPGTQETPKTPVSRILIVDDHPIIQDALSMLVSRESDLTVCGTAVSADEARAMVSKSNPDLLLVDLTLRDSSGISLIVSLQASHPKLPILVFSIHQEALYAERVLLAGARGYIMKTEASNNIVPAIRKVLAGDVYLSEILSSRLAGRVAKRGSLLRATPLGVLTNREMEVFRLFGLGRTTRQAAQDLHLSVKTIEAHREKIKSKLGLKNSTELVQRAVVWVQVEDPG